MEDEQAAGIAERTLQMARERLAALDNLPTSDHVAVFDELHRELSTVLNGLDQGEPRSR
ncbi:hypothetical protein LG943_26280 [Streptomonospora sp. S1-112]|uniref:MarR family transcriptional regulator n=3 Tax=Streptomonospora TaxID=104204 RepID=A0A853BSX7_9ACTN|nr:MULTISPECIES: hypothetical protein [Streptomonospora]MBV2365692.1 hypothetical protein [Streptomonospora nanhaiensis]MDA0567803.1 hypothetical protein [Streptomonospora mangrovi]NYI98869.1 hypothetical protein [Streptomonospora nanhaiensis]